VWEKQATKRLPPASLTKLMTALLVLERDKLQETVRITQAATRETGSRLALKAGEHLRVEDLLAATLLQSANDACHALADHLGGSETAFVQQMNRRARELGLRDTQFRNACGHDASGHYSSALDITRLARELLKHPQVVPLTSQGHAVITTQEGRQYRLSNRNALVGRYEGTLGLKTGYTAKAGTCLVALAKRDGHEVLLVLLHGKDRWWDAVDILDLAFDHARVTP
jgi:D-alanyl-D-alanine carboxypeptidase (penicillin-binding protein 5/6)